MFFITPTWWMSKSGGHQLNYIRTSVWCISRGAQVQKTQPSNFIYKISLFLKYEHVPKPVQCEMSPLRARVKWYYGKIALLSNTLSGCDLPRPSIKKSKVSIQQKNPRKQLTCPLTRDYFNRKYVFQPLTFRGPVSFPGKYAIPTWHTSQTCWGHSVVQSSNNTTSGWAPRSHRHQNFLKMAWRCHDLITSKRSISNRKITWWFQPIREILVKMGIFPKSGWKKIRISIARCTSAGWVQRNQLGHWYMGYFDGLWIS